MQTRITLQENGRPAGRGAANRRAPFAVLGATALILAAALGAIVWLVWPEDENRRADPRSVAVKLPFDPATLSVADPKQLRAVTPAQAEEMNAAIPVSKLPNPAASGFVAPTRNLLDFGRSLECMTAAIYYEAASEPVEGQRAVAQVILNRMRHPAFPHTVCGVVYQGAQRSTGCQFSFTCDGSLARRPIATIWAQARTVAAAALSGSVYAPVGLSTYYHADYVSPYWAPSLTKLAIVGRHIFYRLPGGAGSPGAFSAHYAGGEPEINPAAIAAALSPVEVAADTPAVVGIAPPVSRPVLARSGDVMGVGEIPPAGGEARAGGVPNVPAVSRWVVSRNAAPPVPGATPTPVPSPAPAAAGKAKK